MEINAAWNSQDFAGPKSGSGHFKDSLMIGIKLKPSGSPVLTDACMIMQVTSEIIPFLAPARCVE